VACPKGSWLQRELRGPETLPWSDYSFAAPSSAQLAGWAREHDIALLHAHNLPSLRAALRLRELTGVPVVVTAHTLTVYPEYRHADRIVAVSEAVREAYAEAGIQPGAEVVYCGVDLERFRPLPNLRQRIRRELDVPEPAPLVVSFSRLNKRTAVGRFMEAAARVRKELPDAVFALAGDGPLLTRAEALLKRARLGLGSHFRLLGDRHDIPEILAGADAFALCSSREALGLAVLEGMACGVPSVATNVGGLGETMVSGESGLLTPPDARAISEALLTILSDPGRAGAIGRAGRARVAQHFSLTRSLDHHEAVYETLLHSERLNA
jgi:glycosyltransferase involved in cell wall biosynthesis